jgi:NADH-quinone oxidoreductase subunit N
LASQQTGSTGLVIFALIMSLVAAFYYLRIIKVMYFDPPLTATAVSANWEVKCLLGINGAMVLVLGVFPGGLMALSSNAILRSLGS